MRFERIRLENFKCFDNVDLELRDGVTVIHGLNGSGKSSLLEACFFSLYGAKALGQTLDEIVTIGETEMSTILSFSHAGESYTVEREVRVSDGSARTVSCVLTGPHGTDEGVTDVRERITKLLRMDTEAFVNCAYVRQGEVNKLIDASPSDRQDIIDDLLQLGTLETYRERASDARVGVGRVREDSHGALAEVESQIETKEEANLHERRNEKRTELEAVMEDIERYEENRERARETLERAREILQSHEDKREELERLEADTETLREQIAETADDRSDLADRIEVLRQRRERLAQRRDDLLESLSLDVDTEEAGRQGEDAGSLRGVVADALSDIRSDIESLTDEIRETSVKKQKHDSTRESLEEQAATLESDAAEKREKAADFEAELTDTRDSLAQKREELTALEEDIAQRRETVETKRATVVSERETEQEGEPVAATPVGPDESEAYREEVASELADCRERRAECESDLENARERVEEAENLLAEGKCPECGQPVESSPHVDALDERRERVAELESTLADIEKRETTLAETLERAKELERLESALEQRVSERERLEALLEERERSLEAKEQRIETLRESAAEDEERAETKREAAADAAENATTCQEQIAEYNRAKQHLDDRHETLEELSAVLEDIANCRDEMETCRDQRSQMESLNDERRDRLAEKRERRSELRESVDDERIETARENREEALDYLDSVEDELDALADRRDDLQSAIGAIENEIETLEELRERQSALETTVEHLDSLYEETVRLEDLYGQLRAELRQQNVETLERMLNETFDLVYQNDTYARIELDGEYRLTVYQNDGETLDPEQLSGGERALFNLSLRCAIYRLLAEGIEGTAPLPPLILDEPTVFLDSGHVSRLVELVESMHDRGVAQILVVSHDEELVGAADDLVTVRNDPTTNRSSVHRGERDERVLATVRE